MVTCALLFITLVAGVLSNTVPLKVNEDLNVFDFDSIPRDVSWLSGKSKLVKISNNAPLYTNLDDATTCNAKYSCSSCTEARVCQRDNSGNYKVLANIKCPTTKPYCDESSGTCTNVPGLMCGQADAFICMEDGHFPDPVDSSYYHVCQNGVAHKFQCVVGGEQYNATIQSCGRSIIFTTFSCLGIGNIVAHAKDHAYFAYCNVDANGDSSPLVVERCFGSTKFNMTSQQCEIMCTDEGIYEDIEDCTKYYKCEKYWVDGANEVFVKQSKSCPANTSFSVKEHMCITAAANDDCANKNK